MSDLDGEKCPDCALPLHGAIDCWSCEIDRLRNDNWRLRGILTGMAAVITNALHEDYQFDSSTDTGESDGS